VPEHLRQILSLLKSKDVPINWAQLLSDIRHWERDDRIVQKAWARAFWVGFRQKEEKGTDQTEVSATEADDD
jgi:CRISPR system Cascade subunit CasB